MRMQDWTALRTLCCWVESTSAVMIRESSQSCRSYSVIGPPAFDVLLLVRLCFLYCSLCWLAPLLFERIDV